MKHLGYAKIKARLRISFSRFGPAKVSQRFNLLLALALMTDLLTPFLIWKHILPAPTRWLSHAAVATLIVIAYIHMMVSDHIPGAMWVAAGILVIGVTVALLGSRQGVMPTAWGCWVMFQYPLMGLYAYLQPHWPERLPQRLRTFCVVALGMEVIVQIGQYLTGQHIGDSLAGTFGWHGVAPLLMFIVFVLCLVLGRWLANRQWKTLLWVLALGSVSSVLGEMKIFPVAALALAMLAAGFFILQGGRLRKLVPYGVFLIAVVCAYFVGYNTFVPVAEKRPLETFILDADRLSGYMNHVQRGQGATLYRLGRNFALQYGWNSITGDPTTFLFGFGLGARGESSSLNMAGAALQRDDRNLSQGSSLLVMMQEMGLLGLIVIGGFTLWVSVALFRDIRRYPQSQAVELRYALLLFSLLWPVWLWYATMWGFRVVMLLYWGTLGYALGEPQRRPLGAQQARPGSFPLQHCEDTGQ